MAEFIALVTTNGLVAGLLSGLILAGLARLALIVHERYRTRHVTRFWHRFLGKDLTLVFTEYPPSGEGETSRIAEQAGGKLMTKGMAMALRTLLDFTQRSFARNSKTFVYGDKSGSVETSNFVVLGSPGCNQYAKMVYEDLSYRFQVPYWVDHDTLEIHFQSGQRLIPKVENGHGCDYAVVLRACFRQRPERYVLIIGGCFMYGTQAAASAVTDPDFLSYVMEQVGDEENVTFLLRTPVVNDSPVGAGLNIDNKTYVDILRPRSSNVCDAQ